MRKTTFLLKEADVVQPSSTLHFTEGFLTAMANEWSKIRRYLRELLQEWCPGWPSKFLRCCVVVLGAGADDVLIFSYQNARSSRIANKKTPAFCSATLQFVRWFVRFNGTSGIFHGNTLSLITWEIPHRSWLKNLDFQTACAVLRRHPLFWNMQRITANFKNLEPFILPEESRKRHQEPPCGKPRFSEKRSFSNGWWFKNILPKPVMQKQDP